MAVVLTACDRQTVYNHYEHTPIAGWERNDTLSFEVSPLAVGGSYQEEVGLRISSDYPFMSVSLIIEQTVLPSGGMQRDTLTCNLTDKQGNATGKGVSLYQYRFPLKTMNLQAGESLKVTLRHDMKREILPGITDIGIRLQRR